MKVQEFLVEKFPGVPCHAGQFDPFHDSPHIHEWNGVAGYETRTEVWVLGVEGVWREVQPSHFVGYAANGINDFTEEGEIFSPNSGEVVVVYRFDSRTGEESIKVCRESGG